MPGESQFMKKGNKSRIQKKWKSPSIIERQTGRLIEEEEYGEEAIHFLYHHFFGRVLLKMIFARPYFSFLRGLYYNSFLSKKEIAPFVEKYGLSKALLKRNYPSFGAFFSRKEAVYLREAGKENIKENGEEWKRIIRGLRKLAWYEKIAENVKRSGAFEGIRLSGRKRRKRAFYATSSGKVLAYKIDEEGKLVLPYDVRRDSAEQTGNTRFLPLEIKGNSYSIEKILKAPCPDFIKGGTLLVFRLSLPDYHRYIFPAEGKLVKTQAINGRLDSVRKDAAHFKAFSENKRVVSLMDLIGMGKILHVEVGAMLVGHIHNHVKVESIFDGRFNKKRKRKTEYRFKAGEEKGYFSLGGSTIVELLSDKIVIDDDLFENTGKGLETKLSIGERIGYGKA